MSLVVSDASPLRYMVVCGALEVIPRLYGRLVIPSTVFEELNHLHPPAEVRAWIQALTVWAGLQVARQLDPATQLGLGEREAIALAIELNATEILVDERAARRIATQRGLLVSGTLGVLELASERGLLSLPEAFERLQRTNFRVTPELLREALSRDAARQKRHRTQPRPPGIER